MNNFRIEKVIFNDPATIVIRSDGTKTVVKAENEQYDPEKGLAIAKVGSVITMPGTEVARQRLLNALHDTKATKKDLIAAMEEAIYILEKEV